MQLANLLRETLNTATLKCWQRERTANALTGVAVRLHAAGCSLRETAAILGILGVERSHGAVWSWVHLLADSVGDPPSAQPTRVAVDETTVRINGEWSWVYTAIDLDTKVLFDAAVFGRRGTDPAAAFLYNLTQKHDCSQAVFLVDGFGYLTAFSRVGLSGRLDYADRNHIEK
jgi:putative transposase